MRFQSFIRQCKAGRDCMQGGSTLYTFHVTEQGVMIGVLDSRDGMSDSQVFWCPELSDAQGLALTRRLYEESVSLEQVWQQAVLHPEKMHIFLSMCMESRISCRKMHKM